MKRITGAFLLLFILLSAAGCQKEPIVTPKFAPEDLYLNIDGKQYRCDTNIEAVIAELGTDYEYTEGKSCSYDGLDKTFFYEMAEFYTYPAAEGDLVNEIYTASPAVTTSKGISVGSAKKDVLAQYGEDCEDTGYLLMYRLPLANPNYESASLCFMIEDDLVTAIWVTAEQPTGV